MDETAIDFGQPAEFSNDERLGMWEWALVGLFGALLFLVPKLWKSLEPLPAWTERRMARDLSNDYWLYEQMADQAVEREQILLFGDSVIWGEYVSADQTLSHYLSAMPAAPSCANLGLDGAHPLALEGLIEHYAARARGRRVVLQCNPLWLTSARADLQDDGDAEFSHPRLVPQFDPWVPRYKKDISGRLGVLVDQRVELMSWTWHLQQAYYDQKSIPGWTLAHPYENPAGPLLRPMPEREDKAPHEAVPWFKRGKKSEMMQDYPWVELNTSLQWQAFQRTARLLRERGNQVLVVVGPFNEHLLKERSRIRYEQVLSGIMHWLRAEGFEHLRPGVLPSEMYGDASHPLAEGYELLAKELAATGFFKARQ